LVGEGEQLSAVNFRPWVQSMTPSGEGMKGGKAWILVIPRD
jgi:hypothetical protein